MLRQGIQLLDQGGCEAFGTEISLPALEIYNNQKTIIFNILLHNCMHEETGGFVSSLPAFSLF